MAFQKRSIEQIRDVPPGSILAMLTGEPEDFTTFEGTIRWITRRYDKLVIPFMVLGIFIVLIANSIFIDPTFIFGWTIGQVIAGVFFFALISLFFMLVFSSFILTMKSGKGKGNMKFNLRDKNANRLNDIEIDRIIKNYNRINRNAKRFELFEDILTSKGDIIIPETRIETEITVTTSFESLKGNPIIAEVQEEIKGWKIDIPEEDYPSFEEDEEKKDMHYSLGQQSLMTQETAQSIAYKRLQSALANDIDSRVLIREESPLGKFLDGSKDIYIHVVDFNSEYEYKGKKYPGIIFLHEKKTLQDIFPNPSKAFCMVGWTFGDIPVVTTEFVEIDTYKNIPIFYPTVTKDRLLMIANLGFYDETLPSLRTVTACKNLIELDISFQLIEEIENMGRKIRKHAKSTKKQLRDGLGIDDRALTVKKKLHMKEKKFEWVLVFIGGLVIGLLLFPYLDFLWRAFVKIFLT